MILKYKTMVAVECDKCGELSEEFDNSDFQEMVAAAKRAGWWFTKTPSGDWEHLCPVCMKKKLSANDEFRRR